MTDKKYTLTYVGLKQREDGLQNLEVVKKKEVTQKIRGTRGQGDLSEGAEYDAAKGKQRDIELRIEKLEKLFKNAEVVVEDEIDLGKINIGCKIKLPDVECDEGMKFYIVSSTKANSLQNGISNESPVSHALIGKVVGDYVDVETQAGGIQYRMLEIQRVSQIQHKGVKDVGEQQRVKQADADLSHVLRARRDKLAELQAAGKGPLQITKYDVAARSMGIKDNYERWEGKEAAIAGRMMFKYVMSKASFCNIQDLKGSIQVYVARGGVGEEFYRGFKKMDTGDIVGVKGKAFTTKTGEISIHVTEVTLLSKNLQVLPERFHGLADMDMHYRQRYVDLIMNAEVKDTFIKCSRILAAIRKYLNGENFIEVETPMLASDAGGAAARPFETHFNALDEDFKLRISLELYLKRLIVGGLERVYEIECVFHSKGLDTRHNPEFTLIELYQAYTDYNGMMDLTEKLYRLMAQEVLGIIIITYKGVKMGLGKPFAHITMMDAAKKYARVDFDQIHTLEEARTVAREKGVEFEGCHKKGDILSLFFGEFTEEHLVQPTLALDHPVEISPLTKKKPGNPDYVECFEFFMNGWEMADVYSRINDPIDQRERFRAQEELLAQGGEEASHADKDFLNALEVGMPPTGGTGFGVDRMIVLLMDSPAIRDVLLLPTMKSIDE